MGQFVENILLCRKNIIPDGFKYEIVVIGRYLRVKREFSKLIGFLVVALIAVGLVFNTDGVKDVLLELFNKSIGA